MLKEGNELMDKIIKIQSNEMIGPNKESIPSIKNSNQNKVSKSQEINQLKFGLSKKKIVVKNGVNLINSYPEISQLDIKKIISKEEIKDPVFANSMVYLRNNKSDNDSLVKQINKFKMQNK